MIRRSILRRPPVPLALSTLFLAALAVAACGAKRSMAPPENAVASDGASGQGGSVAGPSALGERKLVYTVEMSMEVADPEAAAATVAETVEEAGGFVEQMDSARWNGWPRVSMTLRVPAPRLDGVLDAVRPLATQIVRETREVEDVTARYVDLDARVRTLRRTEDELEALLGESRQRGAKADEIMAVFREVTDVRAQRESLEATLRVLSRQVDLATLRLELMPEPVPLAREVWRPGRTARRAVDTLLAGLRHLGDLLIFTLIAIVPILLLIAVPIWGLVRLLRWRRRRRSG